MQAIFCPCLFSIVSTKLEASNKLSWVPVSSQAKPLPLFLPIAYFQLDILHSKKLFLTHLYQMAKFLRLYLLRHLDRNKA